MNKETATYINGLLLERDFLLSQRQKNPAYKSDIDVVNETKEELSLLYKAQKTIDYILEEDS
jgi:hypothetical protein